MAPFALDVRYGPRVQNRVPRADDRRTRERRHLPSRAWRA